MAKYEALTACLPRLEAESGVQVERILYEELAQAYNELRISDQGFIESLLHSDVGGERFWHANVEALDAKSVENLLTFVMYANYVDHGALVAAFREGYLQRILRRMSELDGTWRRPNVVTFYHEYERDGYLSNWHEESPFTYGGYDFATSEHWMMWQKACVFDDRGIADQILQVPASDQGKVKWLGKKVQGYSDEVWDVVDLQLMRVGLRQKFVQNERPLNDLLGTGSAVLGEAAGTKDAKWGVGFDKHSPKLADPSNWYGKSLLGRTLMEVRSELRQLCAMDGRLEWPVEALRESQVWKMSLLELSRVPSVRSFALMYATIVAQQCPANFSDARDVFRKVRESIGEVDESIQLGGAGTLPVTGWYELLDEIALQFRLGRL